VLHRTTVAQDSLYELQRRADHLLRTVVEWCNAPVEHELATTTLVRDWDRLAPGVGRTPYSAALARRATRRSRCELGVALVAVVAFVALIAVRRSPVLRDLGPVALTAALLMLLVTVGMAVTRIYVRAAQFRRSTRRWIRQVDRAMLPALRQVVSALETREQTWAQPFDVTDAPIEPEPAEAIRTAGYELVVGEIRARRSSATAVIGAPGSGLTTLLDRLLVDGSLRPIGIRVNSCTPAESLIRRIHLTFVAELPRRAAESSRSSRRLRRFVERQEQALNFITARTTTRGVTGTWRSLFNVSLGVQNLRTPTEPTPADRIHNLLAALDEARQLTGRTIVICVEGWAKDGDVAGSLATLGHLAELMRPNGIHVVVAAGAAEVRQTDPQGRTAREVLTPAFGAVLDLPPLTAEESRQLLSRRCAGFPPPVALFCHVWSGGNPGELVRTARACIKRRENAPHALRTEEVVDGVLRASLVERVEAAIRAAPTGHDMAPLRRLRDGLDADVAGYAGLPDPPTNLAGHLLVAARTSRFFHSHRSAQRWCEDGTRRSIDELAAARAAADGSVAQVRHHLDRVHD
jgi:hypothetical protein